MKRVEMRRFKDCEFSDLDSELTIFDECEFDNCQFEKADFSGKRFMSCRFHQCNLSMANFNESALREVAFEDCKMIGIDFSKLEALLFAIELKSCSMDFSVFSDMDLTKCVFDSSIFTESTFQNCDLSGLRFKHCSFLRAQFDSCNMQSSDLTEARDYIIDPERNNIIGAYFSHDKLQSLLMKYKINVVY